MGRHRRIDKSASATTVSLTREQRLALDELQLMRQKQGRSKPLLTEMLLQGVRLLLKQAGWSTADLEKLFPKQESVLGKVVSIRKRRRT